MSGAASKRKAAEERGPTLAKRCECDRPMRHEDDELGPRCLKCSKGLP